MSVLADLARAKATFQARTLRTILTEGIDMTDQSKPDQILEARTLAEHLHLSVSECGEIGCDDCALMTDAADALTAALDEIATLRTKVANAITHPMDANAIAALFEENVILRTEKHADAEAIGALRRAADVSATIANGALDPTAQEACLRRDLSRVRDHLRKALKGKTNDR